MNAPAVRSTLVTASFGIFFRGVGGDLCVLFQRFLWSGFPQGNSEKFAVSYQIKDKNNFTLSGPPTFFNLLVKLVLASVRSQRVYICMCVYCMYANILLKDTF